MYKIIKKIELNPTVTRMDIEAPLVAKKAEPEAEAPKAAPVAAAPVQETDDLELVAVIAAAIAASENVPVDSFRVRTIKRR